MSLGRNVKKGGNRSSDLYELQVLNRILDAISGKGQGKTPKSYALSTGHTIPAGATEISVFNNSSNVASTAVVNGTVLPAGVTRSFGFRDPIAKSIICNGNGDELLIDYMI